MYKNIKLIFLFLSATSLFFLVGHFFPFAYFFPPPNLFPGDTGYPGKQVSPEIENLVYLFWEGLPAMAWGNFIIFHFTKTMKYFSILLSLIIIVILSLLYCAAYLNSNFRFPEDFVGSLFFQVCYFLLGIIISIPIKILLFFRHKLINHNKNALN